MPRARWSCRKWGWSCRKWGWLAVSLVGRHAARWAGRAGQALQNVVARMWLVRHRAPLGRGAAEPAGLVVLERRDELVPGGYHEGPVGGDPLPGWLAPRPPDR